MPIGSGRKEQPYAFCTVLASTKAEQRRGKPCRFFHGMQEILPQGVTLSPKDAFRVLMLAVTPCGPQPILLNPKAGSRCDAKKKKEARKKA